MHSRKNEHFSSCYRELWPVTMTSNLKGQGELFPFVPNNELKDQLFQKLLSCGRSVYVSNGHV